MSDEIRKRGVESVRGGLPDVEAIYLTYGEAMLATAAKKLGGGDALGLDAEDIVGGIVSDMLVGTIKIPASEAGRLKPYLRRIVANKTVDLLRRRGAESRAGLRQHATDTTDVQEDVETVVLVEQMEERMYLLSAREHHVIIENVKNARTAKEVAAELGITPQYVSQLRASALRKLAANLPFTDET